MKIWISVILCAVCSSQVWAAAYVKPLRFFSQQDYFAELALAEEAKGLPVWKIEEGLLKGKRSKKTYYRTNAGYHGKDPETKDLFVVGTLFIHNQNKTVCPIPGRSYLWQTDRLEIGENPPKKTVFCLGALARLVRDGKAITKWQNPPEKWGDNRERNIVALKGDQIIPIRGFGTLPEIAVLLASQGYDSAINLDGGESMKKDQPVKTALFILSKSREAFVNTYGPYYQEDCQQPAFNWFFQPQIGQLFFINSFLTYLKVS